MQTLETEFQTSTNSKIHSSLLELGYTLSDFGDHWRTKALYRGGDNPTAIKIYKNTGVWQDFVGRNGPMPFKKLVELTLKTSDYSIIKKYVSTNEESFSFEEPRQKLEMDKIYPEECLKKLFPNFSFYNKRRISEETLYLYKAGLASAGRMYRRIVFPVYNNERQIFGFSGRKIDDSNDAPKWKHIGKKNNWIYPANLPDFPEIKDEVILVESIGDSLALTENGLTNNLVTFGLDCSNAIVNFLISKDIRKIIIATNNDKDKDINRGLFSALSILMKLSLFFDLDILKIKLPIENDFSEMHEKSIDFTEWKNKEYMPMSEIVEIVSKNKKEFQKDRVNKFLKKING